MQNFFKWLNSKNQEFRNGFIEIKFATLTIGIIILEVLFISYFNSQIHPFVEDAIITSGNENIIGLAFETLTHLIILYLVMLPLSLAFTVYSKKDTLINRISNKILEMCIEIFKDIFIAGIVGISAYIALNTLKG
ncbi:hypothetical protein [Aerococcus urinaeequi]|uniref:Uncharacterized protein n=1 Tax=Aerococcus urinaeequi TaxID=51665 RepID=A0AAC9A6R3_9LACT|nr:hypothetical protein [Aerococcus urinaeequi]AMB96859.1 hypothetical protein AWM74_00815 [Aerococcus urinaeequi]